MPHLDLSSDKAAALIKELLRNDRYLLSSFVRTLRGALVLPPRIVYAPA
jgi:hypothetical protein